MVLFDVSSHNRKSESNVLGINLYINGFREKDVQLPHPSEQNISLMFNTGALSMFSSKRDSRTRSDKAFFTQFPGDNWVATKNLSDKEVSPYSLKI